MQPADLIETARGLVNLNQENPSQADLNRALSSAYYALFHALCLNCADTWVGSTENDRSQPAWQQVYRSPNHKTVKSKCRSNEMSRFSRGIQGFADTFVELQEKRHEADYDPFFSLDRSDVLIYIADAEVVIGKLQESDLRDRTAFAVWVTMINRTNR